MSLSVRRSRSVRGASQSVKSTLGNVFSAKIRNLTDYHQRVASNLAPPSLDVINTLRYFEQTLLGFLREVQNAEAELFESQHREQERLALFPSLNFGGLYHALSNIIDIYNMLNSHNGQVSLGEHILKTLNHLYLFLDKEILDQLPYNVASFLTIFPTDLHDGVIHLLCNVLLPFVMINDNQTNGPGSLACVLLMVFQFSQNPCHHSQLIECLMSLRHNVYEDVIGVISCGTSEARIPAANLLFHYWPFLNPNIIDRRTIQYKHQAWSVQQCQHASCQAQGENYATKKCVDPLACAEAADQPPPLFFCGSCAIKVQEQRTVHMYDVIKPMSSIGSVCQEKNCQSSNRMAICTCYSIECLKHNEMYPIRLCQECHDKRHTNEVLHLFHSRLLCPWICSKQIRLDYVRAVVNLLKECSIVVESEHEKRPRWLPDEEKTETKDLSDERRMLSRFGIWLLVGLCTPQEGTPDDLMGHLLAMLFQWFGATALLPNDATGAALEQLKTEFVLDWLPPVRASHFQVFVSCLLPHPPEYARVGGCWEYLSNTTDQLKEGLSKILALISYEKLVDFEVWDCIMPYWLEAVNSEVSEADLPQLKIILCKIFELDMGTLPFPAKKVYNFINTRLTTPDYEIQLQALQWIQLLSNINIVIPLDLLCQLLSASLKSYESGASTMDVSGSSTTPTVEIKSTKDGIKPDKKPAFISRQSVTYQEIPLLYDTDASQVPVGSPEDSPTMNKTFITSQDSECGDLSDNTVEFFSLILEILLKQSDLAELKPHSGLEDAGIQSILKVIKDTLQCQWKGQHLCDNTEYDDFVDCHFCRDTTVYFEILVDIMQKICPTSEVKIEMAPDLYDDTYVDETEDLSAQPQTLDDLSKSTDTLHVSPRQHDVALTIESGGLRLQGDMPTIVMATQQSGLEDVEFAGFLPTEEVEAAFAQAVTLTEQDVGMATATAVTATLMGDIGGEGGGSTPENLNFWETSVGKFRFTLEDCPAQLQLIYALMIDIEKHPDPDVVYFLLHSVKYLCLNAETLNKAHRENRGFLIWSQENILIPRLWNLLQAQYSQLNQYCVPLILHCLTLPVGADVFWRLVNQDFMSDDWLVRFAAVEKVTVIGRFLDPSPVRGNHVLQAALANAFCFLIVAVLDPTAVVAQRATIYIDTIKSTAIKCLCTCLEHQFDSVVADRVVILHRLFLLTTLISDAGFLTWDFFLQRFDALSMEAQLKLEQSNEIAVAQDLMHSDPTSDVYLRKVNRARDALNPGENIRSITKGLENAHEFQKSLAIGVTSKVTKTVKKSTSHSEKPVVEKRESIKPRQVAGKSVGWQKLRKLIFALRTVNALRKTTERPSALASLAKAGGIGAMVGTQNRQTEDTGNQPLKRSNESIPRLIHQRSSPQFDTTLIVPKTIDRENKTNDTIVIDPPNLLIKIHSRISLHSADGDTAVHDVTKTTGPAPDHGATKKKSKSSEGDPAQSTVGRMREFTDEESNFANLLNKAIDLENPQRHTMALLTTLFMKFLSSQKTTLVNPDEKAAAKKQSIVLRHMNILLGYSVSEKTFTVTPVRLRASAIVNAFLYSLPNVLDNNLVIGNSLLPIATVLLQFLPSPQRYASDSQPPNYTLWYIEPNARLPWLWSVLLILYKYRFDQPPINETLLVLIELIINTLEAQIHKCRTADCRGQTPTYPRSRADSGHTNTNTTGLKIVESRSRLVGQLRRVFTTVLLMVRVTRSWPRGSSSEGMMNEEQKIQRENGFDAASTTSSSSGDSYPQGENGEDNEENEEIGTIPSRSRHSPSHDRAGRRRAMKSIKKPTFDEREEQMLDEASDERTSDFQHMEAAIELQPLEVGSPIHVDSQIMKQITQFDRSFTKDSPTMHTEVEIHDGFQTMTKTEDKSPEFAVATGQAVQVIEAPRPQTLHIMDSKKFEVMEPNIVTLSSDASNPSSSIPVGESSLSTEEGFLHATTADNSNLVTFHEPARLTKSAGRALSPRASAVRNQFKHTRSTKMDYSEEEDTGSDMSPVGMQPAVQVSSVVHQVKPMIVEPESNSSENKCATADTKALRGCTSVPLQAETSRPQQINLRSSSVSSKCRLSISNIGQRNSKMTPGQPSISSGSMRYAETTLKLRCMQCNTPLETYDEETLGIAIVCLSTFVHREPAMAATYLLRMLQVVARIANHVFYPWQGESNLFVPGNCRSIAKQFIRVVLHQLAPNRLFLELFQTEIQEPDFFKAIVFSLADFTELNPVMVTQNLMENVMNHWPNRIHQLLYNLYEYISCISLDMHSASWAIMVGQFENLLRKYTLDEVQLPPEPNFMFKIVMLLFKVQNFVTFKNAVSLLDPVCKLISQAIQTTTIDLKILLELCCSCSRVYSKDRDKMCISRCVIGELVNAIKFKNSLPEHNYVALIQLLLFDRDEKISAEMEDLRNEFTAPGPNAALSARPYIQDLIDFVGDLHALGKIKRSVKDAGFKEDTLGGELKAGLARFIAIEISRGMTNDTRTVVRFLPWLYNPPSVTQQGPSEFIDCVSHVRLLSWVLLGALSNNNQSDCLPVPLKASQSISDHIQFVLAGFAEQSKESVLHMSALFHAFHLCQLWTVYCEQAANRQQLMQNEGSCATASANVMDFWARLTPALLQLLSHSKVV